MSHMSRSLHDALDETLGFIRRALDRIRAGDGAESELHNVRAYLELHNVRAYLVNILELIERDQGSRPLPMIFTRWRRCSPEVPTQARAWLACQPF
jgi:hypothetical protein